MPRRMGALQVRGSRDDAEQIYWKLSEGEEPAEWGKVLYNDKTSMQSHRTKFRSWLVTAPVTEAFWAAVRNGWVQYGNAWYRINAIGGDRPFEHSTSHKQGAEAPWPPLPKQAAEDTSGLRPGTTFAGRQENEHIRGRMQQAEWLKAATQQKSAAEEVKAVLMELKQETRAEMDKAWSAKAAAPPVTATGHGDGGASTQALEVQVQALEEGGGSHGVPEGRAGAVLQVFRRPAGGKGRSLRARDREQEAYRAPPRAQEPVPHALEVVRCGFAPG
jgi:hypothetical protein